MSRFQWPGWVSAFAVFTTAAGALRAAETPNPLSPPFAEVYSLVRSNLAGATDAELNRAAVTGFLDQLQGRVALVTNEAAVNPAPTGPWVTRTAVFDRAYGFVRVGRVGPGLSNEFAQACQHLQATNQLKGLIVDLRFAEGDDYQAAAHTADLFFTNRQPLLRWGAITLESTAKTKAIDWPMIVLINHDTAGAAEVLAAALREAGETLIIGSPSAGRAYSFQDFALSTGQRLRVATGDLAVGGDQPSPITRVEPDIRIATNPKQEKAFFADPYQVPAALVQAPDTGLNGWGSAQSTNRPRRRLNEAELIRRQREGIDLESEPEVAPAAAVPAHVITDPALSRALDLLKGLALAAKRR